MATNPAASKTEQPVLETERRMCYRVPSDSRPGRSYEVDLLANDGAGFCPCTDFGTRRQPNLDAGCEPWTRLTTCKHCRKASRYFLVRVLRRMAEEENPK